jgi:hypothetical protein
MNRGIQRNTNKVRQRNMNRSRRRVRGTERGT